MIAASPKTLLKPQTIVWVILVVAAVIILYRVNPLQQLAWLRCPVSLMTGLYCPGCGSLRAIHALLHGELLSAVSYNLLAVIALPILLWIGIRGIVYDLAGRTFSARVSPVAAWSVFWAVIGFAILRNLPVAALHILRP